MGQKRRTEKKFAPEMKVMIRVSTRMRGDCFRREGNLLGEHCQYEGLVLGWLEAVKRRRREGVRGGC